MRRISVILSIVLGVQLVAVLGLALTGPDYTAFKPSEPLIAFEPAAVDEIVIDDGNGAQATLRRGDDGWSLPDLHDFPASGDKVDKLLGKLADLKRGLPVAMSSSAHERFKLTEESHERRIVLNGDGKALGEILLGTSPAYREVDARVPDEDPVYSITFSTYEAGAKPEDWMDGDFLDVAEDDLKQVEFPSVTLVRSDDGFTVDGLGEDEEANKEAVDGLISKITNPTLKTVEGRGEEALAALDSPDLRFTVVRNEGNPITYRLKAVADGEDYLLATSQSDYVFRIANYAAKPLVEATRENLVNAVGESSEEASPEPGEPEGAAALSH